MEKECNPESLEAEKSGLSTLSARLIGHMSSKLPAVILFPIRLPLACLGVAVPCSPTHPSEGDAEAGERLSFRCWCWDLNVGWKRQGNF